MEELVFFYPDGHDAHNEPGHPEKPERVEAVRQGLEEAGWWDAFPHLEPVELSPEVLQSVHTPVYLDQLRRACQEGRRLDADTYTTPSSWELALKSAGGALAVAGSVWRGEARRGFALCRPPGHHATRNRGMGFCLLNNIALAAEGLLQSEGARRLAIVDLDLHHGNGTQDIFWERGDVLFVSAHQSPLYPGTGDLDETGAGPGAGATANFPLPPGTGDAGFAYFMEHLILPLLDRFAPQMLLVSYGFDPHWRDPLGYLQLSATGCKSLIESLVGFAERRCSGRIAMVLEGGYDLAAASACGQAAAAALLGHPWDDPLGPCPRPEGSSWQAVAHQAEALWGM